MNTKQKGAIEVQGKSSDLPGGGLGHTVGEVRLLNCLYDARDELRELMQRWDNRLTLETLNIAEQYVKGRLSVILDLDFAGHVKTCAQFMVLSDLERKDSLHVPFGLDSERTQRSDGEHRYEQPMFIGNVQIVKGAQGVIPSLVRLYDIKKESDHIGAETLYCSTVNGGFKFLPCLPKWELGFRRRSATSPNNKLISDMIERGVQVVNSIANDQGDLIGNFPSQAKCRDAISCMSVFLDTKMIKVSLHKSVEHIVQLTDVLIGPFDL